MIWLEKSKTILQSNEQNENILFKIAISKDFPDILGQNKIPWYFPDFPDLAETLKKQWYWFLDAVFSCSLQKWEGEFGVIYRNYDILQYTLYQA